MMVQSIQGIRTQNPEFPALNYASQAKQETKTRVQRVNSLAFTIKLLPFPSREYPCPSRATFKPTHN